MPDDLRHTAQLHSAENRNRPQHFSNWLIGQIAVKFISLGRQWKTKMVFVQSQIFAGRDFLSQVIKFYFHPGSELLS